MGIVLSPIGVSRGFAETAASPLRLGSLGGKRLGMFDNGKPKADVLEARLEALFRERVDMCGASHSRRRIHALGDQGDQRQWLVEEKVHFFLDRSAG